MNVSNKLKNKVIKHEVISNDEALEFVKYMVNKCIVISEHIIDKNYDPMCLFMEICYSYNLLREAYDNESNGYTIVDIGGYKFLVDINFNDDNIFYLKENKYIEYSDDIFDKYLKIVGDINE